MVATRRLTGLGDVTGRALLPAYNPGDHKPGMVHLGIGAFHRAHQAVYTDDALAASGGNWRTIGVSLRGTSVADALNPQNGLYTLVVRDARGPEVRVIGSISHVFAAVRSAAEVMAAMTDPAIRIVSLTVTEKAYGIDRAGGRIDESHPAVAADLSRPHDPSGVLGLVVEALRRRRNAKIAPFTVLCCDNLPENGELVKLGVAGFAGRLDPELGAWIGREVAFPSTMVDRITPAPTARTLEDAIRFTGCEDLAAVETEPFSQWVIEDRFTSGRPGWEAGGALFVDNVAPYERMKLRMLNGAHSMLAYAGFMMGCALVRDVMAEPSLAALVARQLDAAAATLKPLEGIDFGVYASSLMKRFENPAIAHETYQIAMDGTEKLPQRIIEPALHAIRHGQSMRPFAFAIAAWMRYCLGYRENGERYALRDPREDRISASLKGNTGDAASIIHALLALPGLFPAELVDNANWRFAIQSVLENMLERGMAGAVEFEAAGLRNGANR